jgi:hypothetical protein
MTYRYVPIIPMATKSPEKIRMISLCLTPIFTTPPLKADENTDARKTDYQKPD